MKRVAVKYDIEKLIELGFEIYCEGLFQADSKGFMSIYHRDLLSSNEDLYDIVTLIYKERNVVKFKLEFFNKAFDCNVYKYKLITTYLYKHRTLVKINSNNFDYDCMMFKLHNAGLLEIIEEDDYVPHFAY